MKHDVFTQYANKVADLFEISKKQLFSKSKKRAIVDARHLLYYLCYKRPMKINYIQKYMVESGYTIQHSSIIHGIGVMEEKLKVDNDYVEVVKSLEKSVFI